ncbi:MAG: hypothetical protein KC441_01650 [Anaerolineales bacterium]|nr:hypothetical protein [Anaerolineales bacterium]
MKSRIFLFCFSIVLALSFASLTTTLKADTSVGGPIASDTIWTKANSPYRVVTSVDVLSGVTLTIEPGVEVIFSPSTSLQINGQLIAMGTPTETISFTYDGAYRWGNIQFTQNATPSNVDVDGNYIDGSIIQYCSIDHAGAAGEGAIEIQGVSILVDHCNITNTSSRAIYAVGAESSPAWITYNIIYSNYVLDSTKEYIVYLDHSSFNSNRVEGNNAYRPESWLTGGIIGINNSSMRNNIIRSNSTNGEGVYGGVIDANNSIIEGNYIERNTITTANRPVNGGGIRGGGIYAKNSSEVVGNTLISNKLLGADVTNDQILGGGIYAYGGVVRGNTVVNHMATAGTAAVGGGIFADFVTDLSDNYVVGNSVNGGNTRFAIGDADSYGGGIYAEHTDVITGNYIQGNSATNKYFQTFGGGLFAANDQLTISSNTIIGNSVSGNNALGAGAYLRFTSSTNSLFSNNLVVGNSSPEGKFTGGIDLFEDRENGVLVVSQNSFWGNRNFDVVVHSAFDIDGTNNFWATTDSLNVLSRIYDWYDDNSRGKFNALPLAQQPIASTAIIPPSGIHITIDGDTATLTWDEHPYISTGWGYKVYYDFDGPYPPYTGMVLPQGVSPIDVGDSTQLTVTGLIPNLKYYFAVTVYDDLGHESWYSYIVSNERKVFLPAIIKE